MTWYEEAIQILLIGLANGSIIALVALGYTLVYGIIELINFAHGDVFMIGSFIAVGLYGTFGLTESTGEAPFQWRPMLTRMKDTPIAEIKGARRGAWRRRR